MKDEDMDIDDDELSVKLSDLSGMSELDGSEMLDSEGDEDLSELDSDDIDVLRSDSDSDSDDEKLEEQAKASKVKSVKRKPDQSEEEIEVEYENSKPTKRLRKDHEDSGPQTLPIRSTKGKYIPQEEETTPQRLKPTLSDLSEAEDEVTPNTLAVPQVARDMFGRRFGRPGVLEILEIENKFERIRVAKTEIADLGREITGDPEGSVSVVSTSETTPDLLMITQFKIQLLRRIHSLSQKKYSISKRKEDKPVYIDQTIRLFATLSLLTIFLDIIP
jgi:hypothetical protein